MNKFFKSCAAGIMSAVVMAASVGNACAASMGDVDKDTYITVTDALSILRYSVGLEDFAKDQIKLADVDGDGLVTSADALAVLRMALFGGGDIPPVDREAQKAMAAASAAVEAVRNGDFKNYVYYTSNTIIYHYSYDAMMQLPDKSAYDDMIVSASGSDDMNKLVFLTNGTPVSLLDKYGKGGDKVEFTKAVPIDVYDLKKDLLNYYREQPRYSIMKLNSGSGVVPVMKDGDIKINFNGSDYLLSEYRISGDDIIDGESNIEIGNAYKLTVMVNGEYKDKVRVVFVDGKYRVFISDLMKII